MVLKFASHDLKLKHTFRISWKSHDIQPTMIVKLEQEGVYGLGECTTNPFYKVTIPYLREKLEHVRSFIDSYTMHHPEEMAAELLKLLPDDPFVRCALDVAAWDLYAKMQQKPLYQCWGLTWKDIPLTNYTIGLDTPENMLAKIRETPYPIYKIKLGTPNDLEIIRHLRKETDAIFRIDANGAWTAYQTKEYSKELAKLGVEFIEQPTKAYDAAESLEAYLHSELPLIADESCQSPEDVSKCRDLFHGINIKLVKCGGLTPALSMIREATNYGMKVMVGCMTESSVGISAIAHLLPLLDYVDMDGAMLLQEDIAEGIHIHEGLCQEPTAFGSGAVLKQPM